MQTVTYFLEVEADTYEEAAAIADATEVEDVGIIAQHSEWEEDVGIIAQHSEWETNYRL